MKRGVDTFMVRPLPGGRWVEARVTYDNGVWAAWVDGRRIEPPDADPMKAAAVAWVWQHGRPVHNRSGIVVWLFTLSQQIVRHGLRSVIALLAHPKWRRCLACRQTMR